MLLINSFFSPTRETQQRKLQNVSHIITNCEELCFLKITSTLFWLARAVQQLPNYCGPELDLSPFNNKVTYLQFLTYN